MKRYPILYGGLDTWVSTMLQTRTGGRILVDALRRHGTDHIFCVPGESFLAALDALHDVTDIRTIVCRQEGGASMMAEAHGKLTGRPGVCMVTRGPGVANAMSGVHIAAQDSTPLILFVGQVGRDMAGREAFQEVEYRVLFADMAKAVEQIEDPARIPEIVSRAFHTAVNGRAGPVVVVLPEDMLVAETKVSDAGPYHRSEAAPADEHLAQLAQLLNSAERPLAIVGGHGWRQEAREAFEKFASRWGIPVAAAFRFQDRFNNTHDHYVGDVGIGINPALAEAVRNADLLLAIGIRLGEMTTGGYSLLVPPCPRQQLVHVYPGIEELGRVYQPTLAINAGPNRFAQALLEFEPPQSPRWPALRAMLRESYLAWRQPVAHPGPLQLGATVDALTNELPDEAIITNGAGNYSAWVHRHYCFRGLPSQLAPTSGSMGYGLPAAIAAKLAYPERTVVAFAGDGCFLMTGQELATAVQYAVAVIIIVVNNGMYGTIRMHQERHYPGRVSNTDLVNPDFCLLATAYGVHSEKVRTTEDFLPAFRRAQATGVPALLELEIDPETISPTATVSNLRAAVQG